MNLINEFSPYILKRFGERVQKLTIDAGFTCPNRDGKVAVGGCTYCNNKKFNAGSDVLGPTVTEQIKTQIANVKRKYKNINKFIIYFQAYSNTYADLTHLKMLYHEALQADPQIIGLTIGTRPDCIDEDKLDFLSELAKDHYITIEYGLESMNDETLKWINRGHDYRCFKEAVQKTQGRGIKICTHLMIGFPGENKDHLIATAKELSLLKIDYLKIHQLQIVKQTIMGNDYLKRPFDLLTKDQYLDIVSEFLAHLSKDIIVQRVAGDCPKDLLIASGFPENSAQIKKELLDLMAQKNTHQGQLAQI